ncbi:sodium-dependent glucose transporter 1-like [Mercenaria mercenaria]|uniref:sodium-dependent glucose transporter 1-like n=1 Tax=Mercenaria mercenaria TaxID=6596 RepID=UPI00234E5D09|nr:sodium-dependent glucose transporter 1-like [Mercenaria mercenaria]
MKTTNSRTRATCQKVTETAALILTWISLGMYLEIFGPTLKDLILRLDSNYEQLAFAISGRTFGWILGSILGGFLVDRFQLYRHLIITIALATAAIATVAIPWLPSITTMWIFCFIGGVCEQVVNIAGTSVTLSIWMEHAASSLILLHMGYGIGSFIVPLYSYPFLAKRAPLVSNQSKPSVEMINVYSNHTEIHGNILSINLSSVWSNTVSALSYENETKLFLDEDHLKHEYSELAVRNKSTGGAANDADFIVMEESRIEYAYGIAAICLALCSAAFLFYQITKIKYSRRERQSRALALTSFSRDARASRKIESNKTSFLQMINPATCAEGRLWYGLKIFIFIFVFMGNLGGCERMIGSFIRSFAIDQLNFSSVDASLLNTSFWISFSVGRLLFAIAAKWISVRVLIIVETLGVALTGVFLNIFAANNSTALWVLMQPVGFLGAPLWPTGVAFTDYHVKLTGVGMTVQILGASVGGIVHLRLIGYLYETFGPRTFLYQLVGSGCFGLLIAIALDFVGAKHGNRFEAKNGGTETSKCESDLFMSDDMRD